MIMCRAAKRTLYPASAILQPICRPFVARRWHIGCRQQHVVNNPPGDSHIFPGQCRRHATIPAAVRIAGRRPCNLSAASKHVVADFPRHSLPGRQPAAITWVHPPAGFLGLSLLNGAAAHPHARRLPFLGQDRGAPAHLVGGAHRRRAAGIPRHRRRAVPRLPHRLLPGPAAAGPRHFPGAAALGRGPGAAAIESALVLLFLLSGLRHPSRAPLPAVAHALARHPRRPVRAARAPLRLDLPVDHAAHAPDARLDPALARGAPAAGALQRDPFRRQGLHLHRPRRAALQALLAGVGRARSCFIGAALAAIGAVIGPFLPAGGWARRAWRTSRARRSPPSSPSCSARC